MLVIANQGPARVRRKRGLARARQTEEQRGIALGPFVGAAVHRQHAAPRHPVIHRREDALLHLARVVRAQDDHLAALEVEHDAGTRSEPCDAGIGRLITGIDDDQVGFAERIELAGLGADQQVVHEERMVGPRADHPHFHSVGVVPAREAVNHVDGRPRVEVLKRHPPALHEAFAARRDVHTPPPDVGCGLNVLDDSLVLGAAAGLLARPRGQSAARNDGGAFAQDRVLVQQGRRSVPHHFRRAELEDLSPLSTGRVRLRDGRMQCGSQLGSLLQREAAGCDRDDTRRPASSDVAATRTDTSLETRRAHSRIIAGRSPARERDFVSLGRIVNPSYCSPVRERTFVLVGRIVNPSSSNA
jgi:hypothetical protein